MYFAAETVLSLVCLLLLLSISRSGLTIEEYKTEFYISTTKISEAGNYKKSGKWQNLIYLLHYLKLLVLGSDLL